MFSLLLSTDDASTNQVWHQSLQQLTVPASSSSPGGDVVVYVSEIKPTKLAHFFYSLLVSISVLLALSTMFHSINSPDNSAFSLCSSGLFSALLVLPTILSLNERLIQP